MKKLSVIIWCDLIGRWWMNLHKRSCCSTWIPRKINMEFAKDSRKKIVYSRFAKNGNFDQPSHMYNRRKFRSQTLEVKLPAIWTDEKQRRSRRIEKRRAEERRSENRKSQKKEDAGARKGRKVPKHCVFPMICGSRGSKSRLAKARVRSQLARWEMKNCTALWHEAHFQVKMYKAPQLRTTFGSWDVEKVHAVVVRSTFPSQNV